ncbi:aspartic peptidase domain-containing protein [Mycena capillaripes]|nr:aspartic peptidase domain-containing protein [Mycena capillaripes]
MFRVVATLLVLISGVRSRPYTELLDSSSGIQEVWFTNGDYSQSRPEKRGPTSQDLILNYANHSGGRVAGYLLTVNIGTPAQTFDVRVDTLGADLWVGGSSCNGCPKSVPLYGSDKSSTSDEDDAATYITQYGSGTTISGNLEKDLVEIGPFSIRETIFLNAGQFRSNLLVAPMSGEMGLGFSAIASKSATNTPFWHTLIEAAGIAIHEMAFWLGRIPVDETGGVLTLGGQTRRSSRRILNF